MFGPLSLFLNLTDKVEVRPVVYLSAGPSGGGTFVTRQKYPKTRGHSPFGDARYK